MLMNPNAVENGNLHLPVSQSHATVILNHFIIHDFLRIDMSKTTLIVYNFITRPIQKHLSHLQYGIEPGTYVNWMHFEQLTNN